MSEKLICTSLSANFVQIINIERQHWVCASNINCPAEVVDVYDSMPRMSYNCKILQKQLAALAKTIHRELEIRFIDVQHQIDSNDCGLFAIAFAQVLCCKIDSHLTSHSQIDMREHLARCFEEGEMVFSRCTKTEKTETSSHGQIRKAPCLLHMQITVVH